VADETATPRYPVPAGLERTGKSLWRRVSRGYILRPDELVLLEMAARTADTIAQLEAEMQGQPLTARGSMGQLREHPLLSEARQQRAALQRLLVSLKLPDLDEQGQPVTTDAGSRSAAARTMAQARHSTSWPGQTASTGTAKPGPWANGGRA
jgi:hypothetical protein